MPRSAPNASSPSAGLELGFQQFRPPRVHDRDRFVVLVGAGLGDARVGQVAAVPAVGVPAVELGDRFLQLRVARACRAPA